MEQLVPRKRPVLAAPSKWWGKATDPLSCLQNRHEVHRCRSVTKANTWVDLSAKHRRVIELSLRGLRPKAIAAQLLSEGVFITPVEISTQLSSRIAKQYIEQQLSKTEGEAVEQRKALDSMLQDAQDLLAQASRGVVPQPRIDAETGQVVEGEFVFEPVPVRDRISAAKELLNRNPRTAPVTRQQADIRHHGLMTPDAVLDARRDLEAVLAVSKNPLSALPALDPEFPSDSDDEDDGTPPWEDDHAPVQ